MITVQVILTLLIFIAIGLLFPEKVFSKKISLFFLIQISLIWGFFLNKLRLGVVFRVRTFFNRFRGYLVTICFGCAVLFVEIKLLSFIRPSNHSLNYLLLFAIVDLMALILFKLAFYYLMRFIRRKGHNTRNLIIIADSFSIPFIDFFIQEKDWGYHILGVISPEEKFDGKYNRTHIVADQATLKDFITRNPIDDIFYCLPIEDKRYNLEQIIQDSEEIGVNLHIMQRSFLTDLLRSTNLKKRNEYKFISYSKIPPHYIGLKIKDSIDFVSSVIALILFTPLLALIALLVKLEDGGSVFFKQERIGLNGRRFKVYKFRTMVPNAEALKAQLMEQNEADGPVFKIENDPRITKIGRILRKTSLDELPQFYNVIKGDMSVVGPRPPLLKEVQQYERLQLRRLSMKPGITCSWQVWGRHEVTFNEWMQMDLDYIDNWSPLLDLKIGVATVGVILKAKGQ